MKMSLRSSIIGLAVLAAVLPVLVVLLMIPVQRSTLQKIITDEMDSIAKYETMQVAEVIYDMCKVTHLGIEKRLADHLKGAEAELKQAGGFSFAGETVAWTVRDPAAGETDKATLPAMYIGKSQVTPNTDFATPSPLVDTVTKFTHAYCTIFQRMNDKGDMVRVCTSLPDAANKRAIGTTMRRILPDGSENPVIEQVLKGETYFGRALVMNEWHAAAYEPIWDSERKDKVVGMLYLGFNLNEINRELREAIMSIKLGKSGYVGIIGGKGEWRGQYIISKNGERDGERVADTPDDSGRYIIREHVAKAMAAREGVVLFEKYPWKNKNESVSRSKCAGIVYFRPWDWVVYATMYEDDNYSIISEFIDVTVQIMTTGAAASACVLIVVIVLAVWLGIVIARPIVRAVAVSQQIADGDIAEARRSMAGELEKIENAAEGLRPHRTRNEVETLTDTIALMIKHLSSLVGQVQRSSVQMVSTATEITAAAREQESTVTEFGASTTEIAAAVKEISATSGELAKTMQDIKETSSSAETLADRGHSGLVNMQNSMGQLAAATSSISGKLSAINEKASSINNLVTTITKVADETNLLSLNASIEAEKAGEYGRGFAVVAREIRRLADQTAVSTLDIERTVKEMQGSVSTGVMEMDKFSGEVSQWVKSVGDISQQLNQILEQIKILAPRFESVNEGMRSQASGAQQISDAMTQLTEGARNTSESLRHFHEVTSQLKQASQDLQKEVSRFKV